ncbi:MAG TPA: AI-2E family transporter [Candidatus Paceibacterota bacterium]
MGGKDNSSLSITITSGAVIKAVVILAIFWFLYFMRDLVVVILASLVIAAGIEPFIAWFKRFKIPRTLSVIFIYFFIALVLAGLFYFFVPALVADTSDLFSKLPTYLETVSVWNPFKEAVSSPSSFAGQFPLPGEFSFGDLATQLQNLLADTSRGFIGAVSVVSGGILSLILIIVLSFYLAVQEDGVARFLKIVIPVRYESYILDLWRRSQVKIGRWLQGQFLLGLLIGVLVYLGLTILGVKNALLLALLAAVFELIPVFGPILSAVPAVVLAFIHGLSFIDPGVGSAVAVVLFYVLIQQFENHLIYPLVVRKVVGIPPIIVILAIIVGFKLADVLGVILSVPLAAILVEFLDDIQRDKEKAVASVSPRP